MYQNTLDSQIGIPATNVSPRHESLLEKIRARLARAMRSRPASVGKQNLPQTFIEEHLLDDVMGPEIKRTLRI